MTDSSRMCMRHKTSHYPNQISCSFQSCNKHSLPRDLSGHRGHRGHGAYQNQHVTVHRRRHGHDDNYHHHGGEDRVHRRDGRSDSHRYPRGHRGHRGHHHVVHIPNHQ